MGGEKTAEMPDGMIGPTCLIGLISDSSSEVSHGRGDFAGRHRRTKFFLIQDRSFYARNLLSTCEFSFSGWSLSGLAARAKKTRTSIKIFFVTAREIECFWG